MTFAAVIDRLYLEYLEVIDDIPAQVPITTTMTTGSDEVTLADKLTPEETSRLAVGSVVEIGSELIMGLAWDNATRILSDLERGFMGTTPAEHAIDDMLRIAPKFPRNVLFNALADAIDGLTDLWTTDSAEGLSFQEGLWLLDDPDAIEILSAWVIGTSGGWTQVPARLAPEMPIYDGGVPIVAESVSSGSRLTVTYRKRLTRPTLEADTLAELGIDTGWVPIVLLGAAAQIMVGRELTRETTEYLTQVLEAQVPGTELGRRASVSTTMLRVQELLIGRAVRNLTVQHRPRMVMRSPW